MQTRLGIGGVYTLMARLEETVGIRAGRRAAATLEPGCYVYVGSAWGPGGLAARLRRHLCGARRRSFWHIDRLLEHASPLAAVACPGAPRSWEHLLALLLYASRLSPVEPPLGGSDDPHGLSHLARAPSCSIGYLVGLVSGLPCAPVVLEPSGLC